MRTSFIIVAVYTLTSAVFFTFFWPYEMSIGITFVMGEEVTNTFGVLRFFTCIGLMGRRPREGIQKTKKHNRNLITFAISVSLWSSGVPYRCNDLRGVRLLLGPASGNDVYLAENRPEPR
jgi:hypothetical protein